MMIIMNFTNDERGRILSSVRRFTPQEDVMFVISGASGHTGSVVASTLLARGAKVRVIVRDAKKGEAWKGKGAEVALASLDDAKALAEALRGADGVYALVPPDFVSDDPLAT